MLKNLVFFKVEDCGNLHKVPLKGDCGNLQGGVEEECGALQGVVS